MSALPRVRRRVIVTVAATALLTAGLASGSAGATPAPPAPTGATQPQPGRPAAADQPTAPAPAARVEGVRATAGGARQVTVTWDPPARGQQVGATVTVCRLDTVVTAAVSARSCASSAPVAWALGRYDDVTVQPGHRYSYAVIPAVGSKAADVTATPVAVTVPRPVRTETAPQLAATGTGSVAGTVTTSAGAPVPGATARLIGYQYPDGYVIRGSAVTAADGTYRITGLADPGPDSDSASLCVDGGTSSLRPTGGFVDTCWKSAAWDGIVSDIPDDAVRVPVRDGVAVTGVDVALATGATVSGRVTAAAGGAGVSGASVYARGATPGTFRTRTGTDGRYVLAGIPAGAVTVCVDARDATVPAGSTGYAAQCWKNQAWNGSVTPPAATVLPLAAASVKTGVLFALGAAAGATGTVTAAGGAPLAGVDVFVRPVGDAPIFGFDGVVVTGFDRRHPDAVTGADGRWTAPGLTPGRYTACYDPADATGGPSVGGYLAVCTGGVPFDLGYDSVPRDAGTVGLTPGTLTRSDITLPAAGGLTGTVTDAGGTGLVGVEVRVFPAAGLERYRYASTTTGSDGAWTLDGLTPGAVVVCAEASAATGPTAARGWADQCSGGVAWDGVGAPPSGAQTVTVVAGRRTALAAVALAAGGAISGKVTSAAGPVAGAGVTVWSPARNSLPQRATTSADGTYTVRGLGTGRYLVCADPDATRTTPSGLVPQCLPGVTWNTSNQPPATATAVSVTTGATARAGSLTLPRGGSVSGRVTAAGGAPLTGVSVAVATTGQYADRFTTTGADGRYTVTGLTSTSVVVCFAASASAVSGGPSTTGYTSSCWNGVPWEGPAVPDDATPVPVPAGTDVTGIDAQLAAAGGLAGTVTSADRTAGLPGVGVVAFDADGEQAGYATTASDGAYRLTGLTPGSYRVCSYRTTAPTPGGSAPTCAGSLAWGGGYDDPLPPTAATFAVTSGAVTSGASVGAKPGGAVAGTVTRDAGGAVSGSRVDVFDVHADVVAIGTTSADGSYRVAGLPAGRYRVCFESTAFPAVTATGLLAECSADVAWSGDTGAGPATGSADVTVRAGAVTSGIDAALAAGGAVTGSLTEAGGVGVTYGEVDVFDATTGGLVGRTSTSRTGGWRATGLAAGRYVVCGRAVTVTFAPSGLLPRCFRNVAWDGGSTAPAGATAVAVTAAATTTVALALPVAAGIGGRVTGPDGASISGANVTVYRTNGQPAAYESTDADGRYVAGGLIAGGYRVCVSTSALGPRGGGYLSTCAGGVAWDPQGPPPTTATTFTLRLGAVGGPADVTLPEGAGISGTVKDATSGRGLVFTNVSVYESPGGAYVSGASTDGNGAWTAPGLKPGNYAVCLDARFTQSADSPAGYVSRCWRTAAYNGYQLPARATVVAVAAQQIVTGINVALPRAAGVSGRITTDATGAPVAGVQVHVYSANAGDLGGYVLTDADGTYRVTGVPAGAFTVCFDAANATGTTTGLFSECWSDVRWGGGFGVPSGTTPVTFTAGEIRTGLDAGLAASASIRGTVVAAGGSTPPLGNAYVSVLSPAGDYIGYTSTASDGTYSVGGLDAGRYVVCVDGGSAEGGPSAAGYRNQCWRNVAWPSDTSPPVAAATKVVTTAGTARTGIDLALASAAQITGVVTDPDGNSLSDVLVAAYANGVRAAASYSYEGQYTLRGLEPGTYQVCFDGSSATGPGLSGGVASECADDVPWPDTATVPTGAAAFTVTAGTSTTVDAVLAPAAGLSGFVDDASTGGPVGFATVTLYPATGDQSLQVLQADFDGSWSVSGLAPGQYRVCVDPGFNAGYAGQCYDHREWDGGALPSTATEIEVGSGTVLGGIDFDLVPS